MPQRFARLDQACRHSLNDFQNEAIQTLNLLALLKQFPNDVEKQTAVTFQAQREKQFKADVERKRRKLFALVRTAGE